MEILYVPNLITAVRLILLPFIVYYMYVERWEIVFVIGFVAIVSDFFDGAVARKFNMVTDFGRKFDPTVDKIFLLTMFFLIYQKRLAPDWFCLTVIAKDLSIPAILAFGKIRGVKLNFSPTKMGKSAVAFQFLYLILLVSEKATGIKTFHQILIYPVVILCFFSLISYIVLIYKLIKREKLHDTIDI